MSYETILKFFFLFLQIIEHIIIFFALLYVIFVTLFPEARNQATFNSVKMFGKYYVLVHLYFFFLIFLYKATFN